MVCTDRRNLHNSSEMCEILTWEKVLNPPLGGLPLPTLVSKKRLVVRRLTAKWKLALVNFCSGLFVCQCLLGCFSRPRRPISLAYAYTD